jgi:hypothetical protein
MIRAVFYLTAGALVWLAEGFLFSYFLQFHPWQVVLMAVVYLALLGVAVELLRRQIATARQADGTLALWRYLSLAPMIVTIVGSFASLPILLVIAGLGKIFGR